MIEPENQPEPEPEPIPVVLRPILQSTERLRETNPIRPRDNERWWYILPKQSVEGNPKTLAYPGSPIKKWSRELPFP